MTSSTPSITITPAGSTAAHPAPTISLSVTPVPPVPPRYKKPNYHVLHALPLPLTTTPLPPLIPHNPLSLLHIIVAYLFPGTNSHPSPLHVGIFHASTHAIHVTSQDTIKAFWNHGFFGKGSLSRSEPTWVIRRRRALGVIGLDEALTSEEVTERRRGERKEFKRERARAERERREKQLVEEGKIVKEADGDEGEAAAVVVKSITFAAVEPPSSRRKSLERPAVEVEDLEHLQLTLEEAFFLAFGLGVLEIKDSKTDEKIPQKDLLSLFRSHSYFPPHTSGLQPDDPFMLNYVVYHHFRSLGWVVKPGIKFAVDYLLYNRGPVFTHAEFAVLILPAYSHPHWDSDSLRKEGREKKPWHWLHCVNRVSSQVKKTLILVYVEIPPPPAVECANVSKILSRYKVREVALRRWLVSRNRD
ncbi:tRNA splicing endonuclease subunit sen2 [Maublancomyces gigas]|uniref:tRNA-splicing endonuclease subunit Sen2 n=1 Tax=Discina gigas TaxID=1032678 RepID=A0ABR3GUC2_9PEZI